MRWPLATTTRADSPEVRFAAHSAHLEEALILRRLKRWLRPLRPWLRPIWRWLLVTTGRSEWTAEERLGRLRLGTRPIRPIRRADFDAMVEAFPYYRNRWGYMSAALLEAGRLIKARNLTSALELGAPVRPIIVGAHVMDYTKRPEYDASVPATTHDATVVPWPFPDKAFDLFLALQVFEHLGNRQPEAFREVRRIARHAILSLPIDWEMDDPQNIHHMISEERVLSWFAPVEPTRVIENMTGRRKRLIYVFEDLPVS
jgi:Methyltransferase domain